eukprot:11860721-Heterocapsa_arctica.AAC.1
MLHNERLQDRPDSVGWAGAEQFALSECTTLADDLRKLVSNNPGQVDIIATWVAKLQNTSNAIASSRRSKGRAFDMVDIIAFLQLADDLKST